MSKEDLIRDALKSLKIMQLATSRGDQPWLCTVHFYADDDLNLHWFSTEARRHSQEIADNSKAVAYLLVHENTPNEDYVIGITLEGDAECLGSDFDDAIGEAYTKKLGKDPNFVADVKAGKNPHKLYRLKPKNIVLFDNLHFSDNPRQEWRIDA